MSEELNSGKVIEELDFAAAAYAKEVVGLLNDQMRSVIDIRKPEITDFYTGENSLLKANDNVVVNTLQAWGIYFQLLNIAEENTAMRRRRQTENRQGLEYVKGTFHHIFHEAKERGVTAKEIKKLLE